MNRALWQDLQQNPFLCVYLAIGVVVALVYLRQQNATVAGKKYVTPNVIVVFYIFLWPVMLFAMVVNAMHRPSKLKRPAVPSDQVPED